MGEEVSIARASFVSFEPANGAFRAFLSIYAALNGDTDPEELAREAVAVYERQVGQLRAAVRQIDALRRTRRLVPARKVWQVGDLVFRLTRELADLHLELDGVYEHLTRDVAVKRKWLEKAVILRRYVDDVSLIPESLNWGRIEKGTARAARRISQERHQHGSDGAQHTREDGGRGS
jgi:hypothetical protein